jgi:hypothetical protein
MGEWTFAGGICATVGCDPETGLALALYRGADWATNFTCRASVRSEGAVVGCGPGLVFTYAGSDRYYYLRFDMAGSVELGRREKGTRTVLAAASTTAGAGALGWTLSSSVRTKWSRCTSMLGADGPDRIATGGQRAFGVERPKNSSLRRPGAFVQLRPAWKPSWWAEATG